MRVMAETMSRETWRERRYTHEDHRDDVPNRKREVRQSELSRLEVVPNFEDDRVRLKEHVQAATDEREVDRGGDEGRLADEHNEGPGERLREAAREGVALRELERGVVPCVAGLRAQACGLALEQDRAVRLLLRERDDDRAGARLRAQ